MTQEQITIDHKNGHKTTYKLHESGTAYHIETPESVCEALENARVSGRRLKLYFGDAKTGEDWCEELDTTGTIGRSTGSVKIPILLANSRYGGGAVLDHCIIKIKQAGRVLYQHPNYQQPKIDIVPSDLPKYSHNLNVNGKTYSRHKTERSAKMLAAKLS